MKVRNRRIHPHHLPNAVDVVHLLDTPWVLLDTIATTRIVAIDVAVVEEAVIVVEVVATEEDETTITTIVVVVVGAMIIGMVEMM